MCKRTTLGVFGVGIMPRVAPIDVHVAAPAGREGRLSFLGSVKSVAGDFGTGALLHLTPRRRKMLGERFSLWWLLQPKHANGREDKHADRNIPARQVLVLACTHVNEMCKLLLMMVIQMAVSFHKCGIYGQACTLQ